MAPVRQKKRASDQSTASARRQGALEASKIPLKGSPMTPHRRSPVKKQTRGISLHQKQALIDNLQLESLPPRPFSRFPPQRTRRAALARAHADRVVQSPSAPGACGRNTTSRLKAFGRGSK